jgi:Tat protein secretion system quality control protein TatD with DNase activity
VNRLFIETDGLSSIAWMRGQQEAEPGEIPQVLRKNMAYIAAVKNMQEDELYGKMRENREEFFGGAGMHRPSGRACKER